MSLTAGQMGATQLLAQLLASVEDPHDVGVGADIVGLENGVGTEITLPSGDRYLVSVKWQGDSEASA